VPKAMANAPDDHYQAAQALPDDLHRWLVDIPI
jgi:hypothetical protein